MKYCTHCGAEMLDDAVVCVKCGCAVDEPAKATDNDGTMKLLVKIFMILGCILVGPFIYTYKLLKSMNLLAADYNAKG